jgi:hypothetical protein
MVCNIQNYWVFGICPSSGILETRKHSVSETVSGPSFSHLRTETDPVSETLCYLVSRIPDDGQIPKKKTVILRRIIYVPPL